MSSVYRLLIFVCAGVYGFALYAVNSIDTYEFLHTYSEDSVEMEDSVKNHTDVMTFHTEICAGASQISLLADERTSLISLSRIRSRMEMKWGKQ